MAFDPNAHFIQLEKNKRGPNGTWEKTYADYLEVKWRVVWFREEKPNWGLETDAVNITDEKAIFKCTVKDETGRIIATGYGSETPADFGDYIEKAETKAVGRALAYLGYGTQFAPELDEGDRIVDSPVERPNTAQNTNIAEQKKKSGITDRQKKAIEKIVKDKELAPEKMTEIIKERYKKESSKDLTKEEASDLISYIQKL